MARTLVIGDSLGVGTVPYLKRIVGNVQSDVVGGRSSAAGIDALKKYLAKGAYGRIVLDLGTNDATASQLAASIREARRLAPNAQIVLPTINSPWEPGQKNKVLRRIARRDPNVRLVGWAGAGGLAGDHIHATSAGYQKRARLIAKALGGQAPTSSPTAPVAAGALPADAVAAYVANSHDPNNLLNLALGMRRG